MKIIWKILVLLSVTSTAEIGISAETENTSSISSEWLHLSADAKLVAKLSSDLASFDVQLGNLKKLQRMKGVIIIGASGAGKTTLVNVLRQHVQGLQFPKRYITREIRENDDLTENTHVSIDKFEDLFRRAKIGVRWSRNLGSSIELYGFERMADGLGVFYSANSALILEKPALLREYLIVQIFAPSDVREMRLHRRSPDINPVERTRRIEGDPVDAYSHIIVNNYDDFDAINDMVKLGRGLQGASVWGSMTDLGNYSIEYSSRMFDIMNYDVRFYDGTAKTFQYARRAPGVRLLVKVGGKFLLTREWRTEYGDFDYRLPGGKVFESMPEYRAFLQSGETPSLEEIAREAAAREAKEELGIEVDARNLNFLSKSTCGSTVEWDLYYFELDYADKSMTAWKSIVSEESEHIQPILFDREEVRNLLLNDRIKEHRSAFALAKALL